MCASNPSNGKVEAGVSLSLGLAWSQHRIGDISPHGVQKSEQRVWFVCLPQVCGLSFLSFSSWIAV